MEGLEDRFLAVLGLLKLLLVGLTFRFHRLLLLALFLVPFFRAGDDPCPERDGDFLSRLCSFRVPSRVRVVVREGVAVAVAGRLESVPDLPSRAPPEGVLLFHVAMVLCLPVDALRILVEDCSPSRVVHQPLGFFPRDVLEEVASGLRWPGCLDRRGLQHELLSRSVERVVSHSVHAFRHWGVFALAAPVVLPEVCFPAMGTLPIPFAVSSCGKPAVTEGGACADPLPAEAPLVSEPRWGELPSLGILAPPGVSSRDGCHLTVG